MLTDAGAFAPLLHRASNQSEGIGGSHYILLVDSVRGQLMRLRTFRVSGFRCIRDSGAVPVGDLAALIGKNESGKTALLQALLHLNKDRPVSDLDRCDEMWEVFESEPDFKIVEGTFELTEAETKAAR